MRTTSEMVEFLGLGLYTVSDAARLLRVSPASVRRWLGGYSHRKGDRRYYVPPLWNADLPKHDDHIELSFRDLIELRFVSAFTRTGLGLKSIRHCLEYAREVVGNDRPFSTSRFQTDGKTIYLESLEKEAENPVLLDLRSHQYAIAKVLEQSFKDLEIEDNAVARWRPYQGKNSIIVDPGRSFGQPIAAEYGVPTRTLADSVAAEGSIGRASALFEVPIGVIRDAVRFEEELSAA